MNDETTEITYETAVRTFDHTAVASLGAYHRLREALNDIARDADGVSLGDLLEAVRDAALTTPYADSCECVSGFATYPPAWPHRVDRINDWLTCHYRCPWCHREWTCGYAVDAMAWFS